MNVSEKLLVAALVASTFSPVRRFADDAQTTDRVSRTTVLDGRIFLRR